MRAALGCALALVLAAPADAATVRVSRDTVVLVAGAGEANDVTLTLGGDGTTVADAGAPLTAGRGCRATDEGAVICSATSFVRVTLGDADDGLHVVLAGTDLPVRTELRGGAGDDTIAAGGENDLVAGGTGDDAVSAGGGRDTVLEGTDPGDHDTVDGGEGLDELSYEGTPTPVRVDLAAGTGGRDGQDDTLSGFESVTGGDAGDVLLGTDGRDTLVGTAYGTGHEPTPVPGDTIFGRGGRDHLTGSQGADRLYGGAGSDSLSGGGGRDVYFGGSGNDVVQPGTDGHSRVYCGPGRDLADGFGGPYLLAPSCELTLARFGTTTMHVANGRLVIRFPHLSCRMLVRLGHGGPVARLRSRRGARAVFRLPARRRGAIPVLMRSRCHPPASYDHVFSLLLG